MRIRHHVDIGFTVVVSEASDYATHFDIYEIILALPDRTPNWQRKGSNSFDPCDKIEDSKRYLHGHIKWDGCSNWCFDDQDERMLHFCDLKDMQAISKVMERCWAWASELCPNFDGD